MFIPLIEKRLASPVLRKSPRFASNPEMHTFFDTFLVSHDSYLGKPKPTWKQKQAL